MSKIKELKKKWLYSAVGGILLMGFGLSLLGDSILRKYQSATFFDWFLLGTIALALFFAGLSLFGSAVIFKSQIDSLKIKKKQKTDKKN